MVKIFSIGDFHIHTKDEVVAFTDYLNQRPEELLILLGDIIHFAHSFWSPNIAQMGKMEVKKALKEDLAIWKSFFKQLSKPTILYYGTHEMFVFETCARLGWPLPDLPSKINKRISVPKNCEEIELPDGTYVTGLHIPCNVYSRDNPKFWSKKEAVEKWLEKTLHNFKPKKPKKTILCTHEPTDYYYTYMGYKALTNLLKGTRFRVHYHAHIHSNLREDVVGFTPTVNRSILALYQHKREDLEPLPEPVAQMLKEKI
jgi:Icc-related predicted phosphoesterase